MAQGIEEHISEIIMGMMLSVGMDFKLIYMKSSKFFKELYNLN